MPFQVAARAVLELGAELISSDEIAIYELVKNAFDAGSNTVAVDFKVRMRRSEYEALSGPFDDPVFENDDGEERDPTAEERASIAANFENHKKVVSTRLKALRFHRSAKIILQVNSHSEARQAFRDAYNRLSSITIKDRGEGMSLETLRKAFLTIGTPYRLRQRKERKAKKETGKRALLGEKGVGRLSAMRLGSRLELKTGTESDLRWSRLKIDWDSFALDNDTPVGEIAVEPYEGGLKRLGVSGTTLVINGLEADWTQDKLEKIAAQEFSRISDPFLPKTETFPLSITFNGETVPLRRLSGELFKHAHGVCSGQLEIRDGEPHFVARFEYKLYNESTDFEKGPDELRDAITAEVPATALKTLGPFRFNFYWYNRQLLKAIDSIGTVTQVRKLVNSWTGGLMIFRDRFRVNPYGGPGDDWLELDRQAFKSSGYLLNSDQIIGRVQISSDQNPRLVDQTNREGLRDNFEFHALRNLLHHFITHDLKHYIDGVNDEYSGLRTVDFKSVDRNVASYEKRVLENVANLKKLFPGHEETLLRIRDSFQSMKHAYSQARDSAERSEEHVQRLMDLAGVGLLVEVVAHELARATKYTLDLVTTARRRVDDDILTRTFNSLEGQLTTIDRRLRVLDPLSISGRQRKTSFDLSDAIRDVLVGREDELERAGIRWKLDAPGHVRVNAVKGMIYQTLENLVSNSIHWLSRAREENPNFQPAINISVSASFGGSFRFSDNGPGISMRLAETVFDAFFTTRGEEGRGLGLYIARNNARHHGGDLTLTNMGSVHPDRFNTFEFKLSQ